MRDVIDCPDCGGQLICEDVHSSSAIFSCDVCGATLQDGVLTHGEELSQEQTYDKH